MPPPDTPQPATSPVSMSITPDQLLRVAAAFQQKNPDLAKLARFLAQRKLRRASRQSFPGQNGQRDS
jgi:hypothetical protein